MKTDGTYRSYIWLSGSEDLVDLQENSSVESLCFFNGYCLAWEVTVEKVPVQ